MKYAIESWATDYGSSMADEMRDNTKASVDVTCEKPLAQWGPISPKDVAAPETILFTDGVRRVDARIWIEQTEGLSRTGICATYAAGAVLCDGRAKIVAADVQRGLFTPAQGAEPIVCKHATYPVRAATDDTPEQLWLAVHERMAQLEIQLAGSHDADLIVIDGPLLGRQAIPNTVGYVKSHKVSYLPEEIEGVVAELEAGQRTPIFLAATSWSRFCWYLRLPGGEGHAWAGVVRCETSPDLEVDEVISLADAVTLTLPRFASEAHKDPRAPQNLHPIAGLERELRKRLGDPNLLYRGLRIAAASNGAA